MFKKLFFSLVAFAGISLGLAQAQTPVHTPTLEGTYNWTGVDTFPFGNLRFSGSVPQCPGGTVMNGYQFNFTPNCIPSTTQFTAGFNNTVGAGGLTSVATTLTLTTSTSGFPTNGCGYIDTEYMCYASLDVDGFTIDGLTRHLYATTAAAHSSGAIWHPIIVVFSGVGVSPNAVIFGGVPGSPDVLSINNPFKDSLNPTPSIVMNQGGVEWWVGQSDGLVHEHNITGCCNTLGQSQIGQGDSIPSAQDILVNSHNVVQITNQYETQQPIGLGGGIAGGVSFHQPATIVAPGILNGNPTGAVTYSYRCQDHAGLVPGTDSTFTASATPPFPITIVCPRQSGVVAYDIVRTAGGNGQGIVQANVLPGTGFNDNVTAPATPTTVITTNTSQAFIDGLNYLKAGDLYDNNLSVSSSPLCVGTNHILTATGCAGGTGGSPASPVGSIQTNADGSSFGALNLSGILKQTATTTSVASGTSNTTSGDYAQPFDVSVTGAGFTSSFNSQHLVLNLTGAAGTGTVGSGLAHQFASYPSAGTGVQGTPSNVLPGYFVVDPSMSCANITTLLSTAPSGSTVIVLDGTPQCAWSNPNHLRMIDTRQSAAYGSIYQYGIGCDAAQWTVTLTAGTNTVNVGADFGTEAIGRTFSFSGRTGYGFGSEQWAWAPTITAYTFPIATLSGNAPFSGSFKGTVGTLNTTHLQSALDTSSYAFPLQIPTGCSMLTGPLNINHATSVIGQQMTQSRFVSLPGQDVLVQPAGGHGAGGNGMRWENFSITEDASIDWSWGYNQYPPNYTSGGTGVTAVSPVYRPAGNRGHEANNWLGDDWVTSGSNGVASTTANSAVVCVPTALGRTFTNGFQIVFPYFTPGVFSTTILNQTGAGCAGGNLGLTLNTALPNNAAYTIAQAYYVTGSAFQTIETAIPTTMTYPFLLTISLPNGPSPFGIWDFAPTGHVFIGSSQFDYLGINYNNTPGSATMTLRKGPATTPGYTVGSQPIIPANPCPANFNTPPYVTPNLNTGDTTPSGAVDFPGHCVGASAIAFPQPDGTSPNTGMVNSFLTNLEFDTLDVQSQNNVASIYEGGNTGSYGNVYSGIKVNFLEYGFVQGPAAKNNWGISSVGPTSTGNHFLDWQIHAAFPFIVSGLQQTTMDRFDTYSSAVNPYDGTTTGTGSCESLLNTVNEQTGALVTITGQWEQHNHNCEPAGSGSGAVVYSYADIQPFDATVRQENFEAGPAFFGGSRIDWSGGSISVPAFNYGNNNIFRNFNGVGSGAFPTNTWTGTGSNQFYNWGKLSSCSMFYGGFTGPLVSCGALWSQGFEGKSMDAAHDGIFSAPPMNILGGQVKPGMWNTNGSFDSGPMSVGMVLDSTEPYWGVYAGCNLNTSNFCQPNHFFGPSGLMWIGGNSPFLSATAYDLEFNAKSAAASGSFTVLIQVFDSGNGLCSSPGTVGSRTVNTTTSWQHFALRVDLTGRTGCFFSPQFFQSSTTDQYRIGEFDMVPVPGFIRAPAVSDSIEGTSCQNPGAYLGSSATFAYYCASGGTVKRAGIS